jgi:type IX secretion system PorP/SprF family membrane protein
MKKIFTCVMLLLMGQASTYAQDPHFSQYFSSPLTFNPAFTGYFDGSHRMAFNLRRQWVNQSDAYTTGTLSFDTRIMQNSIGSNDKWGLGVMALYDQSGAGIFKNNYLAVSTGFNKGLDAEGNQSIGIGVQTSIARNSVDFSRVSFNSQFSGSGYDLAIPSGETINNNSVTYVDVNAGVLYNYRDENGNNISLGASMYHILKPKLSYFSGNNQSLQSRYTLHAGANLSIRQRDQLFISIHLMQQAASNEVVVGGAYGLALSDTENFLYVGTWMRTRDAVYPYLGLRTPSFQVGLTYDVTTSDLRKIKGFSGGTELSFILYFNRNTSKGVPCFF